MIRPIRRRPLRFSIAILLSLNLALLTPASAQTLKAANTLNPLGWLGTMFALLRPQGGGALDTIRANQPALPDAYVPSGVLPGSGYDDPKPTTTGSFNTYFTELSRLKNDTGVAGSKPLQVVDPTSGQSVAGAVSVMMYFKASTNYFGENVNFNAPVVSLKGRAGLDLNLTLSYNSRVWAKASHGPYYEDQFMFYNADKGFPGPGWRLGFGAIQGVNNSGNVGPYTNSVTGKQSFIHIAPDGTRHDLAYNSTSGKYESYDSSYLQFDATTKVLCNTSGLKVTFNQSATASGDYQLLPTQIKDRNGNYIDIFYKSLANNDTVIDYVIDTLGRRVDFTYQNDRLIDVRQTRDTGVFKFFILDYTPVTMMTNYNQTDPATINNTIVYLPHKLTYPNGSALKLYYTSYGQIHLLEKWVPGVSGQGAARRIGYTRFDFPSANQASYPSTSLLPPSDWSSSAMECLGFTSRSEQAENWNSGTPQSYTYGAWNYNSYGNDVYSVQEPSTGTTPDYQSIRREFRWYVSPSGLTYTLYLHQNTVLYRTEVTKYIKDAGLSYVSNARPEEHTVSDGTNTRKEKFTYTQSNGVWLATQKDEYDSSTSAVYRRTNTTYTHYTTPRIIGLPLETSVYSGAGTTLLARTLNAYDETGNYTDSNNQSAPYFIDESGAGVTQHDNTNFNGNYTQRGNLTSVTQYSVTGGTASAPRIIARTSYDTNGNVRAVADAAGNRSQTIYTDNFSNKPGSVGTLQAYPYTAQNPHGFKGGSEYEYYTGHINKTFNLLPGSSTEQQVVTTSYDFADRPKQTNRPDGGWVRSDYWDNLLNVSTHQQIASGKVRFNCQEFDGAGRTIRKASDHPGAVSGRFSGQKFIYDELGRQKTTSNVIAIDGNWNPADEDAPPTGLGWVYTDGTYDALGRITQLTMPDNATRTYVYDGCGCAGGTVTMTDERGCITRTKKDWRGRLIESAEQIDYGFGSGPQDYNKAVYTYDVLDRLTQIAVEGQWNGSVGTQTRTFVYDGYGRLQSETTPEAGTMSYTWTTNDQVATKTDARGKTTTLSYNTRNLVTGVTYNDSGATPAVSYTYDDWGARTAMTDGEGSTSYLYNGYRQLQSETRTFTGLSGRSYTLGYTYNQGDAVLQVRSTVKDTTTNQVMWEKNVNYDHNATGALTGVGTNLIGSDPNATTNVMSAITYRGLGGVKTLNYGNGRRLSLTYSDQRQYLKTMKVDKQDGTDTIINKQYTYNSDGRIQKIDDFVDTAWTTSYTYDAYNRLTSATGQPNAYSTTWQRNYSYDGWGNLRTVSNQGQGSYAGEAPNYTINYATANGAPATNRIQSVTISGSTTNYTYDAAGNLTAEGSTTYSYDAAGRMKEVGTGGQNAYGFDGDGRRVKKIENGAAAVYCVYSTATGQSLLEVNAASWTPYRAYVVSGGRVIAQQSHDGQFYWLHQDHLGTGHKLTNTTGVVVYRGEFDPHGQVLLETGSLTLNNKKFTGYERDATGLDYAQARMYNHNRGRFMQADPGWLSAASLSKPSSLNRYTYVENDPVNKVDRNGLNLEYWECTWTYRFGSNDGEEWILIGATVRCQSYNVPSYGGGGGDMIGGGTGVTDDFVTAVLS